MTALNAYLETLLWSETLNATDEGGNSITLVTTFPVWSAGEHEDGTSLDSILDSSELSEVCPRVVEEARKDLEDFADYCEETIGFDPFQVFDAEKVASDFLLSRNGHGAGFFDDSYMYEGTEYNDALQDAAKSFGTFGLAVWTDAEGRVCAESHS